MKGLALKTIGVVVTAAAVTTAFWFLSAYSDTFNGLRVAYCIRRALFGVLVSLGMNAHQPSDSAVLALLFCVLALAGAVVVGLAARGRSGRASVRRARR